jgi:hypothetical protein
MLAEPGKDEGLFVRGSSGIEGELAALLEFTDGSAAR